MNFNQHFDLVGKHAFLSASNYHWLNYDSDRLIQVYENMKKKEEGTELHALASILIKRRLKVANHKKALNMFVNDAIGFGMESEQVLFYSDNCFGTADAILLQDDLLRIHDLKTGVTKVSFSQLDIYAALFCLEYNIFPTDIEIEQRIYQGRDVLIQSPVSKDITYVMNKIIEFDKVIDSIKETLG